MLRCIITLGLTFPHDDIDGCKCKSIVALTEADKSKKLSSSVIGVSLKSEAILSFVVHVGKIPKVHFTYITM